jgi:hypothetical protein
MKKNLNHFLFLFVLLNWINCFALSQDEKLWVGVNSKQALTEHWATFIPKLD